MKPSLTVMAIVLAVVAFGCNGQPGEPKEATVADVLAQVAASVPYDVGTGRQDRPQATHGEWLRPRQSRHADAAAVGPSSLPSSDVEPRRRAKGMAVR
jgi:hypothetical protein